MGQLPLKYRGVNKGLAREAISIHPFLNRSWHISTTPYTTTTKNVQVQTNTVVFYGHPELSGKEKSKFELEEKKFSIVLKMEVCGLKTQ